MIQYGDSSAIVGATDRYDNHAAADYDLRRLHGKTKFSDPAKYYRSFGVSRTQNPRNRIP